MGANELRNTCDMRTVTNYPPDRGCSRFSGVLAACLVALLCVAVSPAQAALPDLVITDVLFSPADPQPGDAVTLIAQVKNIGNASSPSGVVHGVLFAIDEGTSSYQGIWSDNFMGSIMPGDIRDIIACGGTAGPTWTATEGNHTIRAIVDDVDRMLELDEGNNEWSEAVRITPAAPPPPQLPGTETVLPESGTGCPLIGYVELSGDRVVWDEPGSMVMGGMSVIYYNITSGNLEVVDHGMEGASPHDPDVGGGTIAYSTGNGDGNYIGIYDIISAETTREFDMGSVDYPGTESCPAVSDPYIVWQCTTGLYYWYEEGDGDIYLYDTRSGELTCICADGADQSNPAIAGTRVVWEDMRGGDADLYLYDLATGREEPVSVQAGDQTDPAISGDRIVWVDRRSGNSDIYLFDLSTGEEIPVCTNNAEQQSPAIDGDYVVYRDNRDGDWDIYLYDIVGRKEYVVCAAPMDQWSPAISGNRIVWVDDRDAEGDQEYLYNTIHLFILGDATPAGFPDLIITDLSWTPANPVAGDDVTFEATIQNVGDGPTPEGVIHGVLFRIDAATGVWSDSHTAALDPGESVTLTANGGSGGTGVWNAETGSHTLTAVVDDVNRIAEGNEENNSFPAPFEVAAPGPVMLLPFPGCTGVPTDTDGDGLFEDINGNHRTDFNDVVICYGSLAWIPAQGLVHYFDFNENDRIDFDDVVELYRKIT